MKKILLILAITLISACQKNTAPTVTPYPSVPLGVSTEISLPTPKVTGASYSALGTEPFWNVEVTPTSAILSRPSFSGSADVTSTKYDTEQSDKGSIVSIKGIKGDLFITLTKGTCEDGMSETKYSYSVVVNAGAEELRGCANKK